MSDPLPSTSPEILRDLAAVIRGRADALEAAQSDRAGSRASRACLSPESLEELADMLLAGDRPTVGWWRRHLPKPGES